MLNKNKLKAKIKLKLPLTAREQAYETLYLKQPCTNCKHCTTNPNLNPTAGKEFTHYCKDGKHALNSNMMKIGCSHQQLT